LKGMEGGGSVAAALRRLCANTAPAFPIPQTQELPQDADCDGTPRNGCPPATGTNGMPCDADGDGFPISNNNGCNPLGLALDCDDNDPHTFPGAPEKCGDGKGQSCGMDIQCTNDNDGDGYTADYDCDDNNPNVHPWANESCNGIDDDCDGLVDEQNPD